MKLARRDFLHRAAGAAASKVPAQSEALMKFLTAPSALKANGMEPGTS